MENLATAIDIYCERTSAELWAEPLNALSNASFLVAAFFIWRSVDDGCAPGLTNASRLDLRILALFVGIVGIGSATFHTVATGWAQLADVIPIIVAVLWFVAIYLRRALHVGAFGLAFGFAAFFAVAGLVSANVKDDAMNGSQNYLVCLATLVLISIQEWRLSRPRSSMLFAAAAGSFALSLTMRTIDMALCATWPLGTHFLWHLFNGVTLYLAARAVISASQQSPEPAGRA